MRIGLAQINPKIGDLAGNIERCLAAIEQAGGLREGLPADLVILPEMAIPGYPPRDILFDPSFAAAVSEATQDLARQIAGGPPVVVGSLAPANHQPPHHPGLYNAALLLQDGTTQMVAAKRLLPAYDIFHEPRWFLPGPFLPPVTIAGKRIGFLICEDMWDEGYPLHPPAELLAAGAELLVCLSASPYRQGIMPQRLAQARRHACPLVYVNLCGGNDELIFDGRSFIIDGEGAQQAQLPPFEEAVHVIDLAAPADDLPSLDNGIKSRDLCQPSVAVRSSISPPSSSPRWGEDEISPLAGGTKGGRNPQPNLTPWPSPAPDALLYQALVTGVRDFARKNRLRQALLGLSGGIDSALVAVIAAEALGATNITAIAIPSRYTDPRSTDCAAALAQALGIGFEVVALDQLHEAAEATLSPLLDGGTTAENIQARLRGMILMSYVNRYGGMLLNTSNKTELSLGYATLYGDMAGTLCPIADLTKPQVYCLARWLNKTRDIIPPFIMQRPPSAELRAEQVDPFDYETVGPALESLVQDNQSNPPLRQSEHKRWQMGVILKVSSKSFGSGRLIPITRD